MEREACAAPPAYWEIYKLVSRALARSVAACLPLNSLQSAKEVAVKVRVQREPHVQTAVAGEVSVHLKYMQAPLLNSQERLCVHTVGDTGRSISDSAEAR